MRRLHYKTPQNWHVMARGARRLALFHEESDYWRFVDILAKAVQKSGCSLYAYVLMSNHFHLLLRGKSKQLSRLMKSVNYQYSLYHNEKYHLSGHAFDGPYKAYLKPTPAAVLYTLVYILLNPVTARIVARPEDYKWSSYHCTFGLPGSPLSVVAGPVLALLDADVVKARKLLHERVERQMKRATPVVSGSPTTLDLNMDQFEWLRSEAHQRQDRFPTVRPTEVAMLWGRECGVPPRAIAASLGNVTPQAVSQKASRLAQKAQRNPDLARRLALP